MNKKLNTILFILGATLFNIIVTLLSFVLLFYLYLKFLIPILPAERGLAWVFSLLFIGSLAIAFLVYRYALRFMLKKIDMEQYFDPLFVRKHKPQP